MLLLVLFELCWYWGNGLHCLQLHPGPSLADGVSLSEKPISLSEIFSYDCLAAGGALFFIRSMGSFFLYGYHDGSNGSLYGFVRISFFVLNVESIRFVWGEKGERSSAHRNKDELVELIPSPFPHPSLLNRK